MKSPSLVVIAYFITLTVTNLISAPTTIPDEGWHLWPDTEAKWQDDTLYLPDEVDLTKLPTNPPTGGWSALNDQAGTIVTLPTTVEQHYWGKFGFRPYKEAYGYSQDLDVQNGNYPGVSWWWREIDIPADFSKKLVLLSIRGMRQRAEIYLNQKLVGYDLIAETSFKCDISKAILPGQKNQLAIRITNYGGIMDWRDGHTSTWGKYQFPNSHGFGGLDRGLTLEAHDPVYLEDTWVLNTPKARTVTAHAIVKNTSNESVTGEVTWTIEDPQANQAAKATQKQSLTVAANSEQTLETPLSYDQAELWDLSTPRLYSLKATWQSGGTTPTVDEAQRTFGFRWFEPRGIGDQAGLYLNDRRVRLITAISWGFWGFNGLWPTQELAEKEVQAAKRLNLNCLNFHREIGKEDVLAAQDRLGLLRYMEPGDGEQALGGGPNTSARDFADSIDVSGQGGEPQTFPQKYETEKIVRMIRQFRSHPSLVIYVIQNELSPNMKDPHVYALLRRMHSEDPSRVVALASGPKPVENQAFFTPYNDTIHYTDKSGFTGWRDVHTVGGEGVWTDDLYKSPTRFTHMSDDRKEIIDWGEMLGSGTADNHSLMVSQILAGGGESYDLKDHQEIATAYDQFLDKWNFRGAFPTSKQLFSDIGDKSYEFWGRVIETARLSEANDILSISGWESTAIENHSGIVDNLRNFKGNPDLISTKLQPLLPVVEPHGVVYRLGDKPVLDLFLLNETGQPAGGQIDITITDPKGNSSSVGSFPAPAYVQDQFVYPVKMALDGAPLTEEGEHRLDVTLTDNGKVLSKNTTFLYAVQIPSRPASTQGSAGAPIRIGLIGDAKEAKLELKGLPNLVTEPYQESGTYDLLAAFMKTHGVIEHHNDGSKVKNTEDDELFYNSIGGKAEDFKLTFSGLPAGQVRLTFYFADMTASRKGQRIFSLDVNGQTVLKDFDIIAEAHGHHAAVIKTVTVDAPNGSIEIGASDIKGDGGSKLRNALVNAVKIEAGDKVLAYTCGGETYTDKSGQVWQPYVAPDAFPESALAKVKSGLPLLLILGDPSVADPTAEILAKNGAFTYSGLVGSSRASWMGSWFFVRDHPIYAGLPVNTAMKGFYQVTQNGQCGLLVDGPGVEIIAAYSRDHDRHIGAATFTTKLGQGNILVQTINGMQPLMLERWMSNAITYLTRNQ